MFLQMYLYLNHVNASIGYENHQNEYEFFGQHVYDEHAISFTLKNELQLFCCLCVNLEKWEISFQMVSITMKLNSQMFLSWHAMCLGS